MKKVYFSMGTMLLAGVVLASCGTGSGLSKPKKGKAVDSIDIEVGSFYHASTNLKISKDSEIKDVFGALEDNYYVGILGDKFGGSSTTMAYNYSTSIKASFSGSNYLDTDNIKVSKKFKNSTDSKRTSEAYITYKQEATSLSSTSYMYSTNDITTSTTYDYTSSKNTYKEIDAFAGDLSLKNEGTETTNKLDFGEYTKYSEKTESTTYNMKFSDSDSEEYYKYFNTSTKSSDSDYGATYYGYDKSGDQQSYCLTNYVDYPQQLASMVTVQGLYSDELKDLYTCSFELTDKHIILKSRIDYNSTVENEAGDYFYNRGETYTPEQLVDKIKEIRDSKYKGTYQEYEVWLKYTTLIENDEVLNFLSIDYFKYTEVLKANFTRTYDDDYFTDHNITNDTLKEEAKGKKYSIKGSMVETEEYAVNTKKFDKKISSFKKKAEKNNIFKDMKMYLS